MDVKFITLFTDYYCSTVKEKKEEILNGIPDIMVFKGEVASSTPTTGAIPIAMSTGAATTRQATLIQAITTTTRLTTSSAAIARSAPSIYDFDSSH